MLTGLTPDKETYDGFVRQYGHTKAQQTALEVAYFKLFGELPSWAVVIESVMQVGENFIFVHRDPAKSQ